MPSVKVQGQTSIPEFGNPYRIEPAGAGFTERTLAGKKTPLNRTETAPIFFESGVSALSGSIYYRCNNITFPVYNEKPVLVHLGAALGAHQFRIGGIILFQVIDFRLLKRSPAVADYAAASFADWVVAGEIFSDNLFRDEDVTYLDNGSETIPAV